MPMSPLMQFACVGIFGLICCDRDLVNAVIRVTLVALVGMGQIP